MELEEFLDIVEQDLKHRCGLEKYREIAFVESGTLDRENEVIRDFGKDIMILSDRWFDKQYYKLDKDYRYSLIECKIKSDDYKDKFWPE